MWGFLTALKFLTRIPTGGLLPSKHDLGRSMWAFPLVGLLLGGVLAGVDWGARRLFGQAVSSALVVVGLAALTGGLHLDGLADTFDGLFSGRSRERILEIMREGGIGPFGITAICCLLLLKFVFLWQIDSLRWQTIILMPILGRWAMVYLIAGFPYARPQGGMGKSLAESAGVWQLLVASLLAIGASVILLSWPGLLIFALIWLGTGLYGRRIAKVLGGLTGDCYGAACELTELAVLGLVLIWPWL